MNIITRISDWLESRWVAPSYSGWLLAAIALALFGAATNTMAGWLYVMSGTIFALLLLAAILPRRAIEKLKIRRLAIDPVSAGDELTIELEISNPTSKAKHLIQIEDILPYVLAEPKKTAIETIPPKTSDRWSYYCRTKKRGVYQWHEIKLRSGNPLGLFWCRRSRQIPGKAIVYPQILPLTRCPIVDSIGQDDSIILQSEQRYQTASQGLTRALRPYRTGDPMRLIHWRTSARLGEFKVRELEIITGGQEVIISLDTNSEWEEENFEQAVIAAASLYFYAYKSQLNVKLWTASTGLLSGDRSVLETLAAIFPSQDNNLSKPPALPLIWLSQNSNSVASLSPGSRFVLFDSGSGNVGSNNNSSGLVINSEAPLQQELQKYIN